MARDQGKMKKKSLAVILRGDFRATKVNRAHLQAFPTTRRGAVICSSSESTQLGSVANCVSRIPILLSKVEKAMDCRIEEVEENMVQWKQAPYRFWLLPGHSTPAQWSFECLQQGRHDGLRRAFHMLNLATDLNSRKQKDESKKMYSRHIDAMMEEWPDHPTLDATAKRNRRKTLRLYLDHGTSLQKLWKLSAGLIFLVAPTLRDVE